MQSPPECFWDKWDRAKEVTSVLHTVFTAEPPQQGSAICHVSSSASLTCSATPGKSAARIKMPIAGFHGSSNKVEGILPRVLLAGRTFCQRL